MITVAVFDFARRLNKIIPAGEAKSACAAGCYCWADIEDETPEAVLALLADLGIDCTAAVETLGCDREGCYDAFPDFLHVAIREIRFQDRSLVATPVDVFLAERCIVTIHAGDAAFITHVRKTYREDFLKFSKSPGFLLFELVDHLVNGYRVGLRTVAGAVQQVQLKLFSEADDAMFRSVSELTRDIVVFRKALTESRELIHEMASRRSLFVSETTQPFLGVLAGTLERLGDDLGTERDVLSETLNLYMGMVGHRTNKVVKQLTVISMIFLPLTFLCGVYGMNLIIPEARWAYTYPLFWVVVVTLATTIVLIARRLKWL